MIKVLHFEITQNRGGIESFLINVSNNMNGDKVKFDFVTTANNKLPFEKELSSEGSKIYYIASLKNIFKYIRDIKNIFRQNNYDVIHIHKNSAINIIPLLIAKCLKNKNVVIHSHNTAPTVGNLKIVHYINRNIFNLLKVKKLACSKLAADWMFGNKKISEVEVVPNGIDLDKYQRDADIRSKIRKKYYVGDKDILLGSVGRLSKQKNHEFTIKLISKLEDKYKLIIVGAGELEDELIQLANELGCSDRIIFTGAVKNVNDYLQAMDIFLMPSLFEGLPVAGVEAQAMGLPILVSDVVSRELRLTTNVYYLSLSDSDEWMEYVKKYAGNFNENAKQQVRDSGYDVVATGKKMEQLYMRMIGGEK